MVACYWDLSCIVEGEAGSVVVLPRRYAPMGPGLILGAVCAFGFQFILVSADFLRVLRFSLLHLKLNFLNKSVSMHYIEMSLEFNAFALLGFAWFSAECYFKKSIFQNDYSNAWRTFLIFSAQNKTFISTMFSNILIALEVLCLHCIMHLW